MAKKPHKKPVGVNGMLRQEIGPEVESHTFIPHIESKAKPLIEADVAAAFVSKVEGATDVGSVALTPLAENDLDFLWEQKGRRAKLELTELVLATPPYKEIGPGATIYYKPWAEKFCQAVSKKNDRLYTDNLPVDLLVYTTHFAYHGNEYCVLLAAERLRNFAGGSNFDRVYYLEYSGENSKLHSLKPYREWLAARTRRELEKQFYMTVNFANGTPVPGGMAFRIF